MKVMYTQARNLKDLNRRFLYSYIDFLGWVEHFGKSVRLYRRWEHVFMEGKWVRLPIGVYFTIVYHDEYGRDDFIQYE